MPTKKPKKSEEVICNICKADPTKTKKDWTFKNLAGLRGHESMVHKRPQTFDKITEQEKADLKDLSKLKDKMTSKESFDPAEIDEIKEKLKPLKTRQTLRDAAAEQSLRTQIAEDKSREQKAQKDSHGDDESPYADKDFKKILLQKSMLAGQDNTQPLLSLQSQISQTQLDTTKQMAAITKDVQDKRIEDLKAENERLRKEGSASGKIEEIKAGAKLLGLTKKGEESDMNKMVEMVLSNVQHIPKIVNAIQNKAAGEALSKYGITPEQNPPTENISPEQTQIPNTVTPQEQELQPNMPAPAPEQMPTDEELLTMKNLRDDYSPLQNYPNLEFSRNQYLAAPTSTAT